VVNVPYSLEELRALAQQLDNDRADLLKEGITIGHWGVDISENRVKVGVVGLEERVAERLQDRYGDRVAPVAANPATSSCTSRENCFPPLRGGVSGSPKDVPVGGRCSIAFLIHYGSKTQWLTAGHCAQETANGRSCPSTPVNYCWFQGGNGSYPIGKIKLTCWYWCNYSDAARAGNLSAADASYKVYKTTSTTMSVAGSQYLNGDDEGDITCLNARYVTSTAGYFCGTIDHIGTMCYPNCNPGNPLFYEQRFATYSLKNGDSGGAVHSYPSSNNVLAYGVQSGCTLYDAQMVNCLGLGVYSHIYRVLSEVGPATVCSTWDPCP
jgi:hypothetical protein